jgi:predicted metal-dependent phosphoesterase TrpH
MELTTQQSRGIIHNHSACSGEGSHPLSVLRQRWASRFRFAAMTEHAEKLTAEAYAAYVQECDALSDEQFRFIPGLEIATKSGHMLVLGCRTFICTRDPFQVIKEASGSVILLAHPEQGHMLPAVLAQADGFEGWNARYMGRYIPPLDWLSTWRKQLLPGKIMTGGNDIHKVDSKRKIVLLIHTHSMSEANILEAIKQGQFTLSNGTFSLTSDGHVLYHGCQLRVQAFWILQARSYRLMRQAKQVYLRMRRKFLHARGKQSDYLMKQVEGFTPQDHHGEGGQPLLQGLIHLIHSLMLRGT